MNALQKLLLVMGPGMQPGPAAHRAVELARRSGASLHVLMPVFDAAIDATAERVDERVQGLARAQFIGERMKGLSAWTASLADSGLRVACEVLWARHAHDAVLARVLDHEPDLVLKDLQRETFLGRWPVIRPSDWKLARLCPVPMMWVQATAPLLPASIAASVHVSSSGTRPGDLDTRVVQMALRLAMFARADLELVHVFPYRVDADNRDHQVDAVVEDLRAQDRARFAEFADAYSVPLEHRHRLDGDPVEQLLRYSDQQQLGLLVLGSVRRGPIERFLLGSTAEAVLAQARCDVLLVQPEGIREALAHYRDLDALRRAFSVDSART